MDAFKSHAETSSICSAVSSFSTTPTCDRQTDRRYHSVRRESIERVNKVRRLYMYLPDVCAVVKKLRK